MMQGGPDAALGLSYWTQWLEGALSSGQLKPVPVNLHVIEGLERVNEGFDMLRKGVSAAKVVVRVQ